VRRRASRLLSVVGRREEGQALALTAVALVVLIGFAGLAIDIGRLYVAQRQLQQAVDAAALAAGQNLPHANTAFTSAVYYSAAPSGTFGVSPIYNQHPASMTANPPTVTFKCLSSLAPSLPCSADLDGTSCHPANSAPPVKGDGTPTNVCNAVKVTETASVSTTLLHLFMPSSFTTVAASSTAAARGGVPHPLDIMVILDTTGSMASACGDPVLAEDGVTTAIPSNQSAKIDCAKDGVRRLLKGLLPCAESVLGACGFSPPLDEVGLEVFPALNNPTGFDHSTDTNQNHTDLALDLNENGTQCSGNLTSRPSWYKPTTGVTFPGWFLNNNDVGYTTDNYLITTLTNNYKLSNFSTTLNPASVIAQAVTWDACAGSAPPIHNGVPNSSYYGANTTSNTFYAGAINVAQSVIASDASRHAQGVIILLSDGDANTMPPGDSNPCHEGIQAAQAAAAQGTWVYSIAYAANQSSSSSCRLDTPAISGFSAMQQMAYTYNPVLGQAQPDPSKFYCVPAVSGCNSASTLAGVFASIGVDLTDSRLLLDSSS